MATLVPITDKAEVESVYVRFTENLTAGIAPVRHVLGWPSGWGEFDFYWHPSEGVWCVLEPEHAGNRYWCCFGTDDPGTAKDLGISSEINFAFEGVNRRIAGAFVKDDDGNIYVAHSGKVGGGRKGVGKEAFLAYSIPQVREDVAWPDGEISQMLIIGMLDSVGFVNSVATFVSEVAAFKDAVRNGTTAERQLPLRPGDDHDAELGEYSPESLLGTASYQQSTRAIEMRLAHGPVVHALRDAIESAGLLAKKTNRIDLVAVTGGDELLAVFEVKTAVDWGSIYGAIGQLMYYGKTGAYTPKRLVAVLPTGGPGDLETRLRTIGIDVVRYEHANGRPVFSGIDGALASV